MDFNLQNSVHTLRNFVSQILRYVPLLSLLLKVLEFALKHLR